MGRDASIIHKSEEPVFLLKARKPAKEPFVPFSQHPRLGAALREVVKRVIEVV
jgi:hypothetical protein